MPISHKYTFFLTLTCVTLSSLICYSQGLLKDSTKKNSRIYSYSLSTSVLISSNKSTPFWLRTNQFGTVPIKNPSIILTGGIASDYGSKKWDWGLGLAVFSSLGREYRIDFSEGYIKGRWRFLEIWGGRRKQLVGLVGDSTLTSGSYIESGNSIPIPRIQIGFQEYVPILKGLFAVKGFWAHGWFDSNPIVKNHWLHQKTLYVQFGKPNWKMRLYGGINHSVQWGGKILTPTTYSVRDRNPSDWIDYWYVISAKRIPTFGYVDPNKYDAIDRGNRIGNQLGSVDFGIGWELNSSRLLIYRQSIYDDGSLFHAANLADGLHGISWRNKKQVTQSTFVEGITVEFLNTFNQGGNTFSLDGGPRGRDDYFNHAQFWGWSYNKYTIGTPFINPSYLTRPELQNTTFTNNNRIKLFHIGINGKVKEYNYLIKTSFSKNSGTYNTPFPERISQLSTLTDLSRDFNHAQFGLWQGFLKISSDVGKLYPKNLGFYLGIRKTGKLNRKHSSSSF